MQIAYYPGCTLKTKAHNLETAAVYSMRELGVELVELDRWNCCGAVYSLADDDLIHLLAPVRDLIRAQEQGFDRMVTLCSMCYNTLARANLIMRSDETKRKTLNDFMEEEANYRGEVKVEHLLGFLRDTIGWDKVRAAVKRPLEGLKLAPYYGCTLTRPSDVSIDPAVTPNLFQDFISALGAEAVAYGAETECCGSYQIVSNPEAAYKTSFKVLDAASAKGADALVLSCPLCEYTLGRRQPDILNASGQGKPLPVIYFTQLLALALGLPPEISRFELNMPGVRELLVNRSIITAH
ncbi:MAG: CoB--CoM heterodisulfide reductase iron-sulfur subunit B family protein [Calditrichota bacterium]